MWTDSIMREPDGSWALDLPAEEVPAELPEPCLGINFARDGMARKEWLALVAVHSDAWIMSVAFYYGAKLNFEQRYAVQKCNVRLPAADRMLAYLSYSDFEILHDHSW
uniref:Alfin-like protein n=1 Tax=Ulva partita TaxID=1605170 RepID=A0A1C9ZPI5_9CHLO|nr:alfin-like protein [Ulva partita]